MNINISNMVKGGIGRLAGRFAASATLCLLVVSPFVLTSCSDDDLDKESVITLDQVDYNAFDKWLRANYVNTYNIDFQYRFEAIESNHSYYLIPADFNQSVEMAHIVKYACLEAFDEAAGQDFTNANFPKQIYLVGNWEWRNNGTYVLGTAEGGKKIFLAGVNYIDTYKNSVSDLNYYYLKTIYHEFTHILNQTVDYPSDFKLITANDYVADSWSSDEFTSGYLTRGFITAYAQCEDGEDFAEMFSKYVTSSEETWEGYMEEAGTVGRPLLESKLSTVRSYMSESWGIDMDELRSIVLRREADIANGKVDLTDLTVE